MYEGTDRKLKTTKIHPSKASPVTKRKTAAARPTIPQAIAAHRWPRSSLSLVLL